MAKSIYIKENTKISYFVYFRRRSRKIRNTDAPHERKYTDTDSDQASHRIGIGISSRYVRRVHGGHSGRRPIENQVPKIDIQLPEAIIISGV